MASLETHLDAQPTCLNCGTPMPAVFCGHCGQKSGSLDLSLRQMVGEYLQDTLSLESRLPRSLITLAARPGELTTEYLAGRRARYLSPLKLYLLASVLAFALYTLTRPLHAAFYGYNGYDGTESAAVLNGLAYGLLLSVPLFAVTLKLLYWRARRPLVHHLVFALHAGTAALLTGLMFLVVDTLIKLGWSSVALAPFDPASLFIAIQVLLAGYLALSLRRVYSGSWPGTLLKCLFLLAMLLVVFVGLALLAAEILIWFDPEM